MKTLIVATVVGLSVLTALGCKMADEDQAVPTGQDATDTTETAQPPEPGPPMTHAPLAPRATPARYEVQLVRWNKTGPWARLHATAGVDEEENVYVTDGTTVYRVNGETAEPYLTAQAIGRALMSPVLNPRRFHTDSNDVSFVDIRSIDYVGDRLYLLNSGFVNAILLSDEHGRVEPYTALSREFFSSKRISVIKPGQLCLRVRLFRRLTARQLFLSGFEPIPPVRGRSSSHPSLRWRGSRGA